MKTWVAFWSILHKDIQNYYLKPPNISWGIIFPFAWTLMLIMRSKESVQIMETLPGLMAMSILFGATSMLAVTITFERRGRSFERLILAPIPLHVMVLAKTLGAMLFGVCNAFVPALFAMFLSDLSDVKWEIVILGVTLIAVTSTLLGLLVAVFAREVFEAQMFSNFFRFPMLFLCGLFFPVASLPAFVQLLSYCLPLTYGVDMLNGALRQTGMIDSWVDAAILIGFSLLLFWLSLRNIEKKWIL